MGDLLAYLKLEIERVGLLSSRTVPHSKDSTAMHLTNSKYVIFYAT